MKGKLFGGIIVLICLLAGNFLIGNVSAETFEQSVTAVVVPEDKMDIISPINNHVYDTKRIEFKINMTETAKSLLYSVSCGDFSELCHDCKSYGLTSKKIKTFSEGKHSILFKAIFDEAGTLEDGGIYEEYVTFIVDTKKPKITKTEPKKGFADGFFEVQYQEDNPKELWMNYGNPETGFRSYKVNLATCYDPNRKENCVFKINLSDYTEQEITYWFNLTDILDRVVESKPRTLKVDVTKPVINSFNYSVSGRKVIFKIDVSEKNFDEVSYIDYNDKHPKWRTLCSSLRGTSCDKRKSFLKGNHKIDIRVLDEAGNFAEVKNLSFLIV